MGYRLYTLLSYLLLPWAFFRLYKKGRQVPAYRQRWSERVGKLDFDLKQVIWIHAVSLGESIAAMPLILKLLKDYPDKNFLMTHMTPSGSAYVQDRVKKMGELGKKVKACYLPYDLPIFIERFLKHVQPEILLLIETELWPNWLRILNQKNIPIVLVNARLSERSYERYAKFKKITATMMSNLTQVLAQTQEEADRFIGLGLARNKIQVTGSLKFDLSIPEDIEEKAAPWRKSLKDRAVWIGASTHPGEESYLLDVHQHFLSTYPEGLLILAPRHPERLLELEKSCKEAELSYQIRSQSLEASGILPSTQVFIVDTMGELLLFFALSEVCFVGGSLVPHGGHNLLEPAALKKASLTGPHVFNFQKITETLVKEKASLMVKDSADLTDKLKYLFQHPEKRTRMGEAGYQVVMANRGALDRQHSWIKKILPTLPTRR